MKLLLPVWLVLTAMLSHLLPISSPDVSSDIAMCGSASANIQPDAAGKFIPPMPGLGTHKSEISTKTDSAQFYFSQGLNFYFSYHFPEAQASFRESSRFDPTHAMTWWGQALSLGPFYNTYFYKMPKEIPDVLASMVKNASGSTSREKDLIEIMKKRYSNDFANKDRTQLDHEYAAAMQQLKKKYPDDLDIRMLFVDAVMLEHRWDFWTNDGTAKPWTMEAINDCKFVLSKDAIHPAALHYYIHLTEASRDPSVALASADMLKDAVPGAGHMVHMSSHMYQRNGLYAKGVEVNNKAHEVNNSIDAAAPNLGLGKDKWVHYYAVQSYCAMTAGMYDKSAPLYQRARDRVVAVNGSLDNDTYNQFIYMIPVMGMVRAGKWDEILNSPAPSAKWHYALVLDNYAKGVAQIRTNNLAAAKQSLSSLESEMKDQQLAVRLMPFNSPLQSCRIAASLLKGEILFAEGKKSEAIESFQAAVKEEDGLVYREPQDWLIPARQFLGMYLNKMKNYKEAEAVYREDLVLNPGNGWSLNGLLQSLTAQKRTSELVDVKSKLDKAFEAAEVKPASSAF